MKFLSSVSIEGDLTINGKLNATSVSWGDATSVSFDNTDTGLESTNVQDAVEELNSCLRRFSFDDFKAFIPQNIPANSFVEFKTSYDVPAGYIIVGIEMVHTGSHLLFCFGTNVDNFAGTVTISTYCTNIANFELQNVAPQLRLILTKNL